MLMDANLDALKRCVRNNEKANDFRYDSWVCGSFGCLFGNDMLAIDKWNQPEFVEIRTKNPVMDVAANEYRLPRHIAFYIFSCYMPLRYSWGHPIKDGWIQEGAYRDRTNRWPAIARLEKLIRYVERKRAIWYEADGRVKESARRTEGDWLVCPKVVESLAVAG